MALLNKLFGKKKTAKPAKKAAVVKASEKPAKAEAEKVKAVPADKQEIKQEIKSDILVAPHLAEKALMNQSSGKYIFKVSPMANKIKVANEVRKIYGVKVIKVNIISVPGKERRVGRTIGFKSGYKKAVVTLAKGQTIEIAK